MPTLGEIARGVGEAAKSTRRAANTFGRHFVNDIPAATRGAEIGAVTYATLVKPEYGVATAIVLFFTEGMAAHRRKVQAGHIPDSRNA